MSINISSDDESAEHFPFAGVAGPSNRNDESTEDFPLPGVAGPSNKRSTSIKHEPRELTQESIDESNVIILSSSSSRSPVEPLDLQQIAERKEKLIKDLRDMVSVVKDHGAMLNMVLDVIMSNISEPESPSAGSVAVAEKSTHGSGSCREKRKASRDQPSTSSGASETVIKKKKTVVMQIQHLIDKIYKPGTGECMKRMNIELHPSLHSAWYMSELSSEAASCGARIVTDSTIFHERLVLWTRERERDPEREREARLQEEGGQLELSSSKTACDISLLVLPAAEVAEHVKSHALAAYVTSVREASGCRLTLVVFGARDYFQKAKKRKKKPITEIELERALTDLIVMADCDSVVVNTPNELALLIVQFTKAIAEAPYKEAKRAVDEKADIYKREKKNHCVAVDENGHGLRKLWQQMLDILPSSFRELSEGICAHYKTPLALYEALQQPGALYDIRDILREEVRYKKIGTSFVIKLQNIFDGRGEELLETKRFLED